MEASKFDRLFTSKSVAGFVGPSFRWNILNYGRIRNNIRVQETRFEQLVVNYENLVLQAAAEVENAIVAFLQSQEEVRFLAESVKATERSVELANTQYLEGAVDFDRVFTLQGFLVTQQDQLAVSRANIALNLIAIYKALGGGWEIRCTGDAPHADAPPEDGLLILSASSSDRQIPRSL